VRACAPFHIDAWVVLPDYMHCLRTPVQAKGRLLPEGDADFPSRWRAIKRRFSKSVRIGEPRSPFMIRRGEPGI
jgi:putative transposase